MISATQARALKALHGGAGLVYNPPDIDGDEAAFGWRLYRDGAPPERISGRAVAGLEHRDLIETNRGMLDSVTRTVMLTAAGRREAERLIDEEALA